MKIKNLLLAAVVAFSTVALSGCEELLGTCSASIDGQSWTSEVTVAAKTGNRYTITGKSGNSTLVININGTAVGTYSMDIIEGSIQAFVYTPDYNTPQNSYVGTTGNIAVTKVDQNRLTGTFDVSAQYTQDANVYIPITGEFSNVLSN